MEFQFYGDVPVPLPHDRLSHSGFIADEATEERSDGRQRIGATARHRIAPERRQSSDVVSADGALDFPVSASASSEPRSLPGRGFFFPTHFGESWQWVSLSDA